MLTLNLKHVANLNPKRQEGVYPPNYCSQRVGQCTKICNYNILTYLSSALQIFVLGLLYAFLCVLCPAASYLCAGRAFGFIY